MLEERIVRYCAPTLAGIKTGNLFNTCGMDDASIQNELPSLVAFLGSRGLGLRLYPKKGCHSLIYLYRRQALINDLSQPEIHDFLADYGYPHTDVDAALDHLGRRILHGTDFPHEVGIFLSYPLPDVKKFIAQGSTCCRCHGHWCVYDNEDQARCLFRRFDHCTACYRNLYAKGHRLSDLTVAKRKTERMSVS